MSNAPPNNDRNNSDLILRYLNFASEINRNISSVIHLTNNLRYNAFQLYNNQNNTTFQINDLFFPPPFIPPPPPTDPPISFRRRGRRRTSSSSRAIPLRSLSTSIFNNLSNVLSTPTQTSRSPTLMHILRSTETTIYGDISSNHIMCPISQQRFVETDRVTRILGCDHLFHANYIREWFHSSSLCPVCRYDITTYRVTQSTPRDVSYNILGEDLSANSFFLDHRHPVVNGSLSFRSGNLQSTHQD